MTGTCQELKKYVLRERIKEQMNTFREKAEMCATRCPGRLARQRDNLNETEE